MVLARRVFFSLARFTLIHISWYIHKLGGTSMGTLTLPNLQVGRQLLWYHKRAGILGIGRLT